MSISSNESDRWSSVKVPSSVLSQKITRNIGATNEKGARIDDDVVTCDEDEDE